MRQTLEVLETMTQILPPEQAYMIWCLSWAGLSVGIFGVLRGYWLLGAIHAGVGVTALFYWADPVSDSWRRILDMAMVQIAIWTFLYESRKAEYRDVFYTFLTLGAMAYGFGWYVADRPWLAGLAHASVHILANIADMAIFLGSEVPLSEQVPALE